MLVVYVFEKEDSVVVSYFTICISCTHITINGGVLININYNEPSCSGDISLLVFKISKKKAVKQPCLDQKIQCLFSKFYSHTSSAYFGINFSGLSPIYPNVILRS